MKDSSPPKWRNILRASAKPGNAAVMINKVRRRLFDKKGSLTKSQNSDWLASNAVGLDAFLKSFDPGLVEETEKFAQDLFAHARRVLSDIPFPLGGPALVRVLYILARQRLPEVIVETGVGSGYSSASFLAAIRQNGKGHLYSSDFPYFRLPNPEQYVGVVVANELKGPWSLFLRGDDENLPTILRKCGKISIFHYDSDKSYIGRQRALEIVLPAMADDGLVIMDDVEDNCFFHDLIQTHADKPFKILSSKDKITGKGKYVGLLGAI
jgi:predicted O-methyltransferase YrrM